MQRSRLLAMDTINRLIDRLFDLSDHTEAIFLVLFHGGSGPTSSCLGPDKCLSYSNGSSSQRFEESSLDARHPHRDPHPFHPLPIGLVHGGDDASDQSRARDLSLCLVRHSHQICLYQCAM